MRDSSYRVSKTKQMRKAQKIMRRTATPVNYHTPFAPPKPSLRIQRANRLLESRFAAAELFHELWTRHGEAEARRIFAEIGRPSTAKMLAEIKNFKLLAMYDSMVDDDGKPAPNVQKLARALSKENENLPPEKRHGPRGTISQIALDKHIRRLLDEREARKVEYRAKKDRRST
jgi:hypothetical protein